MLDVNILKWGEGATGKLYVRQATGDGFAPVCVNGVFDAAYPNSHTRRGRVQGGGRNCTYRHLLARIVCILTGMIR